ncbi:MAG: putative membrane-bound dehydrogenase-like protein [Verrucomicrobiales bacterium]|jgi:putative membrane-bound dehydrogenase-like protein
MRLFFALVFAVLVPAAARAQIADFLADPELKGLTAYFSEKNSLSTDRDQAFAMGEDGNLRVSGEGFGYLRSDAEFADFHMVVEYRWGEHTWSRRIDKARDAGVFVHIHGEDGAFYSAFPSGVEVQLIEGGSGNLNVLETKETEARVLAGMTPIDEKSAWWAESAKPTELKAKPKVTLYSKLRSKEWTDVKGYRSEEDGEELFGEWNRLEVICEGSQLVVTLNGQVVNTAQDVGSAKGKVGIQSEWAEWHVRRWQVFKPGEFKEEWKDEEKTTNTGSGAELLPRELPWTPAQSLAAFEVDGPFEIELVASEPLVCDPVDVVWDEKGRMFVAEMRDYPLPPTHGPLLSRIRILEDEDGDGLPDKSTIWADNVDHVQGLLPMNGGLLATTRTKILFLKDEDNDGFADEPKVLFQSNEPSHSQLQVSSPRWGRDNWIYLNNGLNGKEIYPGEDEDAKFAFSSRNIRIHPVTLEVQAVSGYGQFGATIDDWGRRFACTNRSPVIFAAMPLSAVSRNPHAGLTKGHVEIAPFGGVSKVYPYELSHTTSNAHLGTHTAACGLGVYRGDLSADLKGDVFVCEPPGQLVTRSKLVYEGANLKAERVRIGKQTEFLRSADEWFRPVNIRTGPDGALYVCDMYRRFIDHARFFPDEFQEAHYMRAGFDQGRIWRIKPKGSEVPKVEIPEDLDGWIGKLNHPNGWMRETAQRMVVEGGDEKVVATLIDIFEDEVDPLGKLHLLRSLDGLGGLPPQMLRVALNADQQPELIENAIEMVEQLLEDDSSWNDPLIELTKHEIPRVRYRAAIAVAGIQSTEATEALVQLAIESYDDPWIRKAIQTRAGGLSGEFLFHYFAFLTKPENQESFNLRDHSQDADLISEFMATIAADGAEDEMLLALRHIQFGKMKDWMMMALIDGLAKGLPKNPEIKSLAVFFSKPPFESGALVLPLKELVDRSVAIAVDRNAVLDSRLAALPMLSHILRDARFEHFSKLIEVAEPPEIRAAAWSLAKGLDRKKVADLLFEQWPQLDPASRGEAIKVLVGSSTAVRLMKEMQAGRINKGLADPMSKWVWLRSKNEEMRSLAEELFARPSADRAAVLNDYRAALELEGDVERGRQIFTVTCSVCHKVDGVGADIGPDITDVRNKPVEGLLSDILDPSRATEARWTSFTVELTDGRVLFGRIGAETADAITLVGLGVNETIQRSQIKAMTDTGLSLMPVGVEAGIDKQQMADLLQFLRKR